MSNPIDETNWERPGLDMTRDIEQVMSPNTATKMTRSMSIPVLHTKDSMNNASHIAEPGGFRRHFMRVVRGVDVDEPFIFGDHYLFARFQLHDEKGLHDSDDSEDDTSINTNQYKPLVEPEEKRGASVRQTVLMILKSFVCEAILFLPRGFYSGGLLFSPVILTLSAIMSIFGMLRLVKCYEPGRDSFGGIAEAAYGSIGVIAVEIAIFFSQIGFGCATTIFVAKTIHDVIYTMSSCNIDIELWKLIMIQYPIYTAMSWIRHIKKFGPFILIADALIITGLMFILGIALKKISDEGFGPNVVALNENSYALFLGTAVYCFEGIGLVMPMHSAMDSKIRHKFSWVLSITLVGVTMFFILFASSCYAAYGSSTRAVIALNLPQNPATRTLQMLYSVALIFSFPLLVFPAIKISEKQLFPPYPYRPVPLKRKWLKNLFRASIILGTSVLSIAGAKVLDNFVALIGSVCCIPLAFICPCLFHLKLRGGTRLSRAMDIGMVFVGVALMLFTAIQVFSSWKPHEVEMPEC